jgi:hypothetical protein
LAETVVPAKVGLAEAVEDGLAEVEGTAETLSSVVEGLPEKEGLTDLDGLAETEGRSDTS